jgi:hypothetical protein
VQPDGSPFMPAISHCMGILYWSALRNRFLAKRYTVLQALICGTVGFAVIGVLFVPFLSDGFGSVFPGGGANTWLVAGLNAWLLFSCLFNAMRRSPTSVVPTTWHAYCELMPANASVFIRLAILKTAVDPGGLILICVIMLGLLIRSVFHWVEFVHVGKLLVFLLASHVIFRCPPIIIQMLTLTKAHVGKLIALAILAGQISLSLFLIGDRDTFLNVFCVQNQLAMLLTRTWDPSAANLAAFLVWLIALVYITAKLSDGIGTELLLMSGGSARASTASLMRVVPAGLRPVLERFSYRSPAFALGVYGAFAPVQKEKQTYDVTTEAVFLVVICCLASLKASIEPRLLGGIIVSYVCFHVVLGNCREYGRLWWLSRTGAYSERKALIAFIAGLYAASLVLSSVFGVVFGVSITVLTPGVLSLNDGIVFFFWVFFLLVPASVVAGVWVQSFIGLDQAVSRGMVHLVFTSLLMLFVTVPCEAVLIIASDYKNVGILSMYTLLFAYFLLVVFARKTLIGFEGKCEQSMSVDIRSI